MWSEQVKALEIDQRVHKKVKSIYSIKPAELSKLGTAPPSPLHSSVSQDCLSRQFPSRQFPSPLAPWGDGAIPGDLATGKH